ncbi:hypothetical protein SISNIDRAFT_487854 [Sistotremastrum niveocremeum HHB9708]|uniref:Uncharacterized protein n=1 Tax=Sistotremastrum niveocremeum HHB9708 TaxID=1314777 RepID=A0A164S576_9AGAM|nr:hypothetical protein SISNIDRAFT_487854 [Sistotremastrum niveocremeum HHB9708]
MPPVKVLYLLRPSWFVLSSSSSYTKEAKLSAADDTRQHVRLEGRQDSTTSTSGIFTSLTEMIIPVNTQGISGIFAPTTTNTDQALTSTLWETVTVEATPTSTTTTTSTSTTTTSTSTDSDTDTDTDTWSISSGSIILAPSPSASTTSSTTLSTTSSTDTPSPTFTPLIAPTSSASPQSASKATSGDMSQSLPRILGAFIGGFFSLLFIIAFVLFMVWRARKRRRARGYGGDSFMLLNSNASSGSGHRPKKPKRTLSGMSMDVIEMSLTANNGGFIPPPLPSTPRKGSQDFEVRPYVLPPKRTFYGHTDKLVDERGLSVSSVSQSFRSALDSPRPGTESGRGTPTSSLLPQAGHSVAPSGDGHVMTAPISNSREGRFSMLRPSTWYSRATSIAPAPPTPSFASASTSMEPRQNSTSIGRAKSPDDPPNRTQKREMKNVMPLVPRNAAGRSEENRGTDVGNVNDNVPAEREVAKETDKGKGKRKHRNRDRDRVGQSSPSAGEASGSGRPSMERRSLHSTFLDMSAGSSHDGHLSIPSLPSLLGHTSLPNALSAPGGQDDNPRASFQTSRTRIHSQPPPPYQSRLSSYNESHSHPAPHVPPVPRIPSLAFDPPFRLGGSVVPDVPRDITPSPSMPSLRSSLRPLTPSTLRSGTEVPMSMANVPQPGSHVGGSTIWTSTFPDVPPPPPLPASLSRSSGSGIGRATARLKLLVVILMTFNVSHDVQHHLRDSVP